MSLIFSFKLFFCPPKALGLSYQISYIRKEKYSPATTPAAAAVSRSGDLPPPWILKRGGVENSGHIIISSNGKTKRIAATTKYF